MVTMTEAMFLNELTRLRAHLMLPRLVQVGPDLSSDCCVGMTEGAPGAGTSGCGWPVSRATAAATSASDASVYVSVTVRSA